MRSYVDLCHDLIHLLLYPYVKWTVQKSWSKLGSQRKAKLSRSIWSENQCRKSQVKDQRIRTNKKAAGETTRRPWINPRQVRSLLGVTGALAQGMTETPKHQAKTSQKHLKSSEADVNNMSGNCKVSSRCRRRPQEHQLNDQEYIIFPWKDTGWKEGKSVVNLKANGAHPRLLILLFCDITLRLNWWLHLLC